MQQIRCIGTIINQAVANGNHFTLPATQTCLIISLRGVSTAVLSFWPANYTGYSKGTCLFTIEIQIRESVRKNLLNYFPEFHFRVREMLPLNVPGLFEAVAFIHSFDHIKTHVLKRPI